MTYSEQILEYLRRSGENICDDCLALVIPLKYRQQAHSRCSELESLGKVIRARDQVCGRCRQIKIGTRYPGARPHPQSFKVENTAITLKVPTDRSGVADSHDDRPWSWEGNVQSAIATWLSANAWTIRNLADTAARSSGIDIVAECDAKELWVSVKGYPTGTTRTNPSTQARHWFAHAVFDIVRYRTQHSSAVLAIGLPDIGVTYRRLFTRSKWAFEQLPAAVIWVNKDGQIRVEGTL